MTGATGPAGSAGTQGIAGPTGVRGATGAIGPQGTAGPAGDNGTDGATGASGVDGPTGATGPSGATGVGLAAGDTLSGGDFTATGPLTTTTTKIQFKRGTASALNATNPLLSAGEPCYETDTGKFKLGDGTTYWTALAYQQSNSGLLYLASVPATATAPSTVGQVAYDENYFYIAVGTNAWKRVLISTW